MLLALLFLIPKPPIEKLPDSASFEVDVEGPQQEARHANVSAPVPASTVAPTPSPDAAHPRAAAARSRRSRRPPPPPPPLRRAAAAADPARPVPPPPVQAPPPTPEPAATLAPPPPPAPPTPAPPLPVPPPPVPPPPVPRPASPTPHARRARARQPNQTRNPAPDSRAVLNTLDRLLSIMQQRNGADRALQPGRVRCPGGGRQRARHGQHLVERRAARRHRRAGARVLDP